jgi:hypothetical protein
MLLIVEPVGQRRERSDDEGRGLYDSMLQFADGLKARGVLCGSVAAQRRGRRARQRARRPTHARHGPFAEAKEMVGGFFCSTFRPRAGGRNRDRMSGCALGDGRSARLGPCFT